MDGPDDGVFMRFGGNPVFTTIYIASFISTEQAQRVVTEIQSCH